MKDFSKLIEQVDKALNSLKANMAEEGMVEEAQNLMLGGEEIRKCIYCHTFNSYSIYFNKKENWETFRCAKCGKVFLIDWKSILKKEV